jgi:hypothetical protein
VVVQNKGDMVVVVVVVVEEEEEEEEDFHSTMSDVKWLRSDKM